MNRRTSQTAVIVSTAIIGGLLLISVAIAFAFGFLLNRDRADQRLSAGVDGIAAIDVRMNAGEMVLEFADVPEASLDVVNGRGVWDLRQRGDTLIVHSPRTPWFDFCFGRCRHQEVTLTLPSKLQDVHGFRGNLELAAGELIAEGSFDSLHVDVSAGEVSLDANVREFTSKVSAGEVNGDLTDVDTGAFRVSAGATDLTIHGRAPRSIDVRVSAGSTDLDLPEAEYRLTSDVSAGELDHELRTNPSSPHAVDVSVSAGSVTLR